MRAAINNILIIAGTHGNEPQSSDFAYKLLDVLKGSFSCEQIGADPFEVFQLNLSADLVTPASQNTQTHNSKPNSNNAINRIILVPNINQWGLENQSRTNKNGVDLNRNLATKDWSAEYSHPGYFPGKSAGSEAESKALTKIIDENDFDLIVSLHTNAVIQNYTPALLNFDAPKEIIEDKNCTDHQAAINFAKAIDLPLTYDMGYPTPGSLGTHSIENGLGCLTVEFDHELSSEELWQRHAQGFIDFLAKATVNKA